jgi:hypothetical protein
MISQEPCPPHHWRISEVMIDGMPHDHHECVRCGAQKDRQTLDSPSMFWERAAKPEAVAEARWKRQHGGQLQTAA